MSELTKNKIDKITNEVLNAITIEMKMIDDLETELIMTFDDHGKALKQKSIDMFNRKLERNLSILKAIRG